MAPVKHQFIYGILATHKVSLLWRGPRNAGWKTTRDYWAGHVFWARFATHILCSFVKEVNGSERCNERGTYTSHFKEQMLDQRWLSWSTVILASESLNRFNLQAAFCLCLFGILVVTFCFKNSIGERQAFNLHKNTVIERTHSECKVDIMTVLLDKYVVVQRL